MDLSWELIENNTMPIKGVAKAELGKQARVSFRHRYLDKDTKYLDMRVAPREMMPDLCDILRGIEVQYDLGMKMHPRQSRLENEDVEIGNVNRCRGAVGAGRAN